MLDMTLPQNYRQYNVNYFKVSRLKLLKLSKNYNKILQEFTSF